MSVPITSLHPMTMRNDTDHAIECRLSLRDACTDDRLQTSLHGMPAVCKVDGKYHFIASDCTGLVTQSRTIGGGGRSSLRR